MSSTERFPALDYLKAFAIVAVVFSHSGALAWVKQGWDLVLTRLWTPFHVPSFLFVSGFLYASAIPQPLATVRRRLWRIVLPYLIASVAAVALGVAEPKGILDFLGMLATGSAVGVYYYVLLACVCSVLIWPLSRMPTGALAALLLGLALLTALQELQPLRWGARSIFWSIRDPLEHFMAGYFVCGWLAFLHRERLAAWGRRRAGLLIALASVGVVVGALGNPTILRFGREWPRVLYSFSVVILVFLSAARRTPGAVVRFLSEATLGLYLFHYLLLALAAPWTAPLPEALRILAQASIGLGGATVFLLLARGVLGRERARRLLGA